jgi:hypothetical protein
MRTLVDLVAQYLFEVEVNLARLLTKYTLLVQVTFPNTNVPIEELPAPSYSLEKEICIAIK